MKFKKLTRRTKKSCLIQKIISTNRKNLGVSAIAKKAGCSPTTVSRYLNRAGKVLPKSETANTVSKEKLDQAMALIFLGLNRDQIEHLLGIKSETLKKYLLKLLMEVPDGEARAGQKKCIFNSDRWDDLARTLGKKYQLKEFVLYLPVQIENFSDAVVDAEKLMSLLKAQIKENPEFVARKIENILGRTVKIKDGFIVLRGHKNKIVKIPTSRFR